MANPTSPGRKTPVRTRSRSRDRLHQAAQWRGHYDNAPENMSQLNFEPTETLEETPIPSGGRGRGRPKKAQSIISQAQTNATSHAQGDAMTSLSVKNEIAASTVGTAISSGMSDDVSTIGSLASSAGGLQAALAAQMETAPSSTQLGDLVEENTIEQNEDNNKVEDLDDTLPPNEAELPTTVAPPKRPAYKFKAGQFLRNRFKFSSGKNSQTQVITNEDGGLANSAKPIAFKIPNSNTILVNEPIKVRLARVACFLGFNTFSLIFHACIWTACFIAICFFQTYYFPESDERKVRLFHNLMTRDNELRSIRGHFEMNQEIWLRMPRFVPEFGAVIATVFLSCVISKIRGRPVNGQSNKMPLVNLY